MVLKITSHPSSRARETAKYGKIYSLCGCVMVYKEESKYLHLSLLMIQARVGTMCDDCERS